MTFEFLKMKSKIRENEYYFEIFMRHSRFDKLLIHLGGDLKTRKEVIKFVLSNGKNDYTIAEDLGSSETRSSLITPRVKP